MRPRCPLRRRFVIWVLLARRPASTASQAQGVQDWPVAGQLSACLYSHYLGALLLPALALFHLFFVRKQRRWWQPVALLGWPRCSPCHILLICWAEWRLIRANEQLHARAPPDSYPEVLSLLLRYLEQWPA